MKRKRLATSMLHQHILHRIFKKASLPRISNDLKMKFGNRIPFSEIRKHNDTNLFIKFREEGYRPHHGLQIMAKL